MAVGHVSDYARVGKVEAGLRTCEKVGYTAAADLTSAAAAAAGVDTRAAKIHVSAQVVGQTAKKTLEAVPTTPGNSAALSGSSLTNIYNNIDGTWNEGLCY